MCGVFVCVGNNFLLFFNKVQDSVLIKRQEAEIAGLKMLRFSLGVSRMDKIRNEYIRGTAQVGCFREKI